MIKELCKQAIVLGDVLICIYIIFCLHIYISILPHRYVTLHRNFFNVA